MTGQTSPEFSSSSPSQMDYYEEGSTTPNNMKSKVRANALYNTPRARRFTERVAEAVEVSSLNRALDDVMVLDSPSPVRNEDVDMMDPSSPLQLRNNKTIRKRRSLIKFNEAQQQRQRRKLRHTQQQYKLGSSSSSSSIAQASRGSDDDYEDDQEDGESDDEYVYSNGGTGTRNSRRLASRQSSVGSEEGGIGNSTQSTLIRSTTTPTGRTRRRLRLQNSNNIPMDTPEIDEDASPTFFPSKTTRTINPVVVEPIVLGTTHGVTRENRRRRPNPIAKKLDRLRHAPDINMLDLSKHLIIPDNTNHNNAASPSSSTSTTGSTQQRQEQRGDRTSSNSSSSSSSNNTDEEEEKQNREESPISIPDNDNNVHDNGEDDDDDDDMMMEQASQGIIENQQQPSEALTPNTTATTLEQKQQQRQLNDPIQNSPPLDPSLIDMEDQSMSPMVHDTMIESPGSPITPQPMTTTEDNHTMSKEIAHTHTNRIVTTASAVQQEPTPVATQSEMESTTMNQEEQETMIHKIKQENGEDEEYKRGEEGHGKAQSREDSNSYLGRVVGSVSRFFWGA